MAQERGRRAAFNSSLSDIIPISVGLEVKLHFSYLFYFIFISWRLITLQYCSGFCHMKPHFL